MGNPLIVTKYLIPGRRPALLRRPRLLDFLYEHLDRKLILVSAPAGYGKTSLLAEFAHDVDLPVCWYSLDRSDRDLRVFIEYLLAAIRQRFPGFGHRTLEFLEGAERTTDADALVGILVNEIHEEIADYFVIVLDDYNLVNPSEAVNYFLGSLLQRLPENCHLIIASRTIPTLTPRGLAVLTARQEVAGLGARELRFTAQEIQQLVLQNYQQELPDEVAQELARQSEGWITGIVLSAQATWKDLIAGAVRARGASSGVYEYLANEVFSQQIPEVQQFLLGSSILDEMSAARCDALLDLDHSAGMLDLLEQGNIFIVRFEKDEERWYRYHALFQSFLRHKLATDDPERAAALHRRAAEILTAEGEWDAAFQHHMAAGDVQGAVELVLRCDDEMWETGRLATLAQWIDQLPPAVLADQPRLLRDRGRVYMESGDNAHALPLFERACRSYQARGDVRAVAHTLVNRAETLRMLGRPREAIEDCKDALARLAELPEPAPLIAAGAHRNQGISLCQIGRMAEGTEELRRALELYQQAGSSFGLALTHGDLGVALCMGGSLAASEFHFEQALDLWLRIGHAGNIANALNSLAMTQQLRGDYERALATLDRALDYAQQAGSRRPEAMIWAGKGDLYRETGQWEAAAEAYNEAWRLAEALPRPSLLAYLLNANALVLRGQGDYAQALAMARRAYEHAAEQSLAQDAARYQVTLAAICLEQGNPTLAGEYLEQAERAFARADARRDLALTWLQMARVAHARGDRAAAVGYVRRMVETAMELGHDQFLVPEAARAVEVLEEAAAAGVGGPLLASLLERARRGTALAGCPPPAAPSQPTPLRLRILALGETAVYVNDRPVSSADWGSAKAKELLFYLLSFPARRKEQIGAILWPDLSPAHLRSAFHVTLYRLRRALGVNDCVLYEDDQYMFNRRLDYSYDVEEFEALLAQAEQARSSRPQEAEACLQRAVALYRGEFLEDMAFTGEEWSSLRREELEGRFLAALQALGDLRMARKAYAEALEAYRKLLARDPLREEAHRAVMRCLALMGDRNAALRHYQSMAALLYDELGVEPGAETVELYRQLAAGAEPAGPRGLRAGSPS